MSCWYWLASSGSKTCDTSNSGRYYHDLGTNIFVISLRGICICIINFRGLFWLHCVLIVVIDVEGVFIFVSALKAFIP
jgi:hypothetical protein